MKLIRICAFIVVCVIFFAESVETKIAFFVLMHRTNVCLRSVIVWGRNKIFTQV